MCVTTKCSCWGQVPLRVVRMACDVDGTGIWYNFLLRDSWPPILYTIIQGALLFLSLPKRVVELRLTIAVVRHPNSRDRIDHRCFFHVRRCHLVSYATAYGVVPAVGARGSCLHWCARPSLQHITQWWEFPASVAARDRGLGSVSSSARWAKCATAIVATGIAS